MFNLPGAKIVRNRKRGRKGRNQRKEGRTSPELEVGQTLGPEELSGEKQGKKRNARGPEEGGSFEEEFLVFVEGDEGSQGIQVKRYGDEGEESSAKLPKPS